MKKKKKKCRVEKKSAALPFLI